MYYLISWANGHKVAQLAVVVGRVGAQRAGPAEAVAVGLHQAASAVLSQLLLLLLLLQAVVLALRLLLRLLLHLHPAGRQAVDHQRLLPQLLRAVLMMMLL